MLNLMEYLKQKPSYEKQNHFPWLEIASGGVSGVVAGLMTFKKFDDDLIAKFPDINEKLGLDIQTISDYKDYYDEAKKWSFPNRCLPASAEETRILQIKRYDALKEFHPNSNQVYVAIEKAVVAGIVVAGGIWLAKTIFEQMQERPTNIIIEPNHVQIDSKNIVSSEYSDKKKVALS